MRVLLLLIGSRLSGSDTNVDDNLPRIELLHELDQNGADHRTSSTSSRASDKHDIATLNHRSERRDLSQKLLTIVLEELLSSVAILTSTSSLIADDERLDVVRHQITIQVISRSIQSEYLNVSWVSSIQKLITSVSGPDKRAVKCYSLLKNI